MKYSLEDFCEHPGFPALKMKHFPTLFQAVVFRNWNMVQIENLAKALDSTPERVEKEAAELGLRKYNPERAKLWMKHGYLTVIRQNWEILNYKPLLKLLGWEREKLVKVLREEDFMWTKMGMFKPLCPEVTVRDLSPEEAEQTGKIRSIIESFVKRNEAPEVFGFLKQYENDFSGQSVQVPAASDKRPLRMIYSYWAPFGDVLAKENGFEEIVSPGLLREYAKSGINAIWINILLSDLVPWTGDEDISNGWEIRLKNLRGLATLTKKYGIELYLYLNEPRALPESILARHKGWGGTPSANGSGTQALCIMNREVSEALKNGVAELCGAVPELGGFLAITMSENLTHCLSKSKKTLCPRCMNLPDASEEVTAVLKSIYDGMRSKSSTCRLIAWNWGWSPEWDEKVLKKLPADIDIMCVSETSLETDCRGIKGKIVDYSIAHPGPGPVAERLWKMARKTGHKVMAKVQLNASWELSSLPYVPAPHLVKRHLDNLKKLGIQDFLLSWTLGGAPGGNLPLTDCQVSELIRRKFGTPHAQEIERGLLRISEGFEKFPFSGFNLIYGGPQNYGPANLLWPFPTGRRATMVGFCYDDVRGWGEDIYSPELLGEVFSEMASDWMDGLQILRNIPQKDSAFLELLNIAEAGYCLIRSSYNQIAFYKARDEGNSHECRQLAREEKLLAYRLLEAQKRDSRIGFEASNHYMYNENVLLEKIINCENIAGCDPT